jgi:tRNA-dihydrouridine synthase B
MWRAVNQLLKQLLDTEKPVSYKKSFRSLIKVLTKTSFESIIAFRMLQIGSKYIPTNTVCAPLSGCSDLAFRLIVRVCGAKFCFFEMVDAHSLLCPHPRRFDMLATHDRDTPIAAQLLGSDPALMLDAARVLLDRVKVDFLDINSACPVRKVIKKQAGAALLQNPEQLFKVIETLSIHLDLPITVKLRSGFTTIDLPALERLALGCEAHGAAALFVHGRTRSQGYSGQVNYEPIRTVKHAVSIPVFGSGDIFSPQLAQTMLAETDCDGVLVARGAFGNPWLFREIETFLQTGELLPPPSILEKKILLKRHLAYIDQYKQNSPAGKLGFMRKVALWYLKGFPNASTVRGMVNTLSDYAALLRFLDQHMQESL